MYKIYINETPLILAKLEDPGQLPPTGMQDLVSRYPGTAKYLLNFCDMLEKTHRYDSVHIYAEDYEKMVADFHSLFKEIPAAGGLVLNDKQEILAIYRRKSWDLPKGKIDKGESTEEAAIREVQEETGLQHIRLIRPLHRSYHTYRLPKGKRVLKETSWYLMETSDEQLTPQAEEDIEKAIWIDPQTFLRGDYPMYRTIREVVEHYLESS